jgi:hypothetical protein
MKNKRSAAPASRARATLQYGNAALVIALRGIVRTVFQSLPAQEGGVAGDRSSDSLDRREDIRGFSD